MSSELADQLLAYLGEHHPSFRGGVEEARRQRPALFDRLADRFLGWAADYLGEQAVPIVARSFAGFTTSVNISQIRYEESGRYPAVSHQECLQDLYTDERMDDYLWGVYGTFFMWAHHLDIADRFENFFLRQLEPEARLVELAFGHGGWGIWALSGLPGATLDAIDISPSSAPIAQGLARAAGVEERARYTIGDALAVEGKEPGAYDAAICGFVLEHLDQPEELLRALAHHVKPQGLVFLTTGLTAAHEDHVYEFRRESEVVAMAEQCGFRVIDTLSSAPSRTLSGARFLPRSMSLVLSRRRGELW